MENKKQSGLDIDLGNRCSANAYGWAKKTFKFRSGKKGDPKIGLEGSFANSVFFGNERIGISSDGIGTKVEVAERMQKYDTLGFDLVAMVVDDLIVNGFEPTNLSNIIDVDFLDYDIINSLMSGLYKASENAKIAVTGGEIAELGNRICGYGDNMHFNWTATAIGTLISELENPMDGSSVRPGDTVISLQSRGFRSNGFSLARKILTEKYGDDWHNKEFIQDKKWGDVLLTPSIIYSPAVTELFNKRFNIKAAVHITGGGIGDNLKRALKKNGLGAEFDNLFAPHLAMQTLGEMGNIPLETLYRIWNMGNGMLIILPSFEAESAVTYLNKMKYNAKVAGKITKDSKIVIKTENAVLEY